jgi:His-Xaa-Ser system protein HxsD
MQLKVSDMVYSSTSAELVIALDKATYSESVLYKCFYWYTGHYRVQIAEDGSGQWIISLAGDSNKFSDEKVVILKNKISQDLIDFKLREIVTRETQIVKELLIAKAFAHYEEQESPISEISDPVGFNPEDIKNNDQSIPNNKPANQEV